MSKARNARRIAKKLPDASKAIEALSNLSDMAKMAQAMAEVQLAAATLVEDNQQLRRRTARLEYILEFTLGSVPYRFALAEFDRLHPEPEAVEET